MGASFFSCVACSSARPVSCCSVFCALASVNVQKSISIKRLMDEYFGFIGRLLNEDGIDSLGVDSKTSLYFDSFFLLDWTEREFTTPVRCPSTLSPRSARQ